jgi:hypothetical protein
MLERQFKKLNLRNTKEQKYLIHLNKLLHYYIYNKTFIIIKIFYASHSNNDIIILFKNTNKQYKNKIFKYIIKLNYKINITNQIINIDKCLCNVINKN